MNKLVNFLATTTLSTVAVTLPNLVNAAELVQTQTASASDFLGTVLNSLETDYSVDFTFDQYNPANFNNRDLLRVEIDFSGSSETDIVFTNTSDNSTGEVAGATRASIFANFAGDDLELLLNVLPAGEFGTVPSSNVGTPFATGDRVFVEPNDSLELLDISGEDSTFASLEAELFFFTGTGSFDVPIVAAGQLFNFNASGGNISTDQTTIADATLEIKYFVEDSEPPNPDPTPIFEPTSLFSLIGLFIVGAVGSKNKQKSEF